MSVILNKQPQLFSPSHNPVLYQFGSTYSDILYFKVRVFDAATNDLIINDRAFVTPISPTGSEYNISDVMRSTVKWDVTTSTASNLNLLGRSISKYYLEVACQGTISGSGSTIYQLGATSSTDTKNVWYGKLNRNDFYRLDYRHWVIDNVTLDDRKFLTMKPDYVKVNRLSFEQLYFMKSGSGPLISKVSTFLGSTPVTIITSTASTDGMWSLDVSPSQIVSSNYDNYTVRIFSDTTPVSESRHYIKEDAPCKVEIMNVCWINRIGGLDSYQFIAPLEIRDATRTTINKNDYKMDSKYNYNDRVNNVMYPSEEVIDSIVDSSYKVWTKPLSNEESYWLGELLESKQIFIQLQDEFRTLYPVVITDTSYAINKLAYSRNTPMQTQFTFKVTGSELSFSFLTAEPTTSTTTTTTTQPSIVGWRMIEYSSVTASVFLDANFNVLNPSVIATEFWGGTGSYTLTPGQSITVEASSETTGVSLWGSYTTASMVASISHSGTTKSFGQMVITQGTGVNKFETSPSVLLVQGETYQIEVYTLPPG